MVDVGVAHHDGIDAPGVEGHRGVELRRLLAGALEEAGIEQRARAGGMQRLRDLLRSRAEQRVAGRGPALLRVLGERLGEGEGDLHRQRERRVAAAVLAGVMGMQVEIHAARGRGLALPQRLARQHERQSWRAMQALVGRRGQRAQVPGSGLDRQCAEAADRIEQQRHAARAAQPPDGVEVVPTPGRGLEVHDRQVRKARIARERGL